MMIIFLHLLVLLPNVSSALQSEYRYYLVNSKGRVSKNGLVLFARDNFKGRTGPVEIDIELGGEGNNNSCVYDHICKIVGFEYALDVFPSPSPVIDVGAFYFRFNSVWCPAQGEDGETTFQLEKIRKTSGTSGPVNSLLVCGPIKPAIVGKACPISVVGKFLKKVCIEDYDIVVLQCHNSETVYTYAGYVEDTGVGLHQVNYMTDVCENDPYFYQSCGMNNQLSPGEESFNANSGAICNTFITQSGTKLDIHERHPFRTLSKNECDGHYKCEDEALCNGFLYGAYCTVYDGTLTYVNPKDVCDERVILSSFCSNFIDQTNCSDPSRSSIVCAIGGYFSTVSKFFVCHGHNDLPALCDNGIDQVCQDRQQFLTCRLHKHQLCDDIRDCKDGTDEDSVLCRSLTNRTCTRAFMHERALRIPLNWLGDGVEDCLDGVDERDMWPSCGVGRTKRFLDLDNSYCGEVFLCSHQQAAFVQLQDLCDGKFGSCGNEKRICDKSHLAVATFDKPINVEGSDRNKKFLLYCLPGLESLQNLADKCVHKDIDFLKSEIFGIKKLTLALPDTKIDCDHTFGEVYLLLSCAGFCTSSPCPIRKKIEYNSCPGQHTKRIYTVADNEFLSFVTGSRDGYKNDYFLCDNGFCISFDQVCNLIDECGDGSDELSCTNVFICDSENQFIPMTEKCDGNIDCADFSDECNTQCGRQILQNMLLKVLCWFLGVLATATNCVSIAKILSQFSLKASAEALNNDVLILLIHLGDLLVGIYLLGIAIIDTVVYRSNYCWEQIKWLSIHTCNYLGILSTIGYQFSLGSVTALSLTRVFRIRKGIVCKEDISKNTAVSITIKTLSILAVSFAGAVVPLMPHLEDFFVNGMTYDPLIKLFIGSPGKRIHMNILQEYYGKVKEKDLTWRVINDLIDDMFSSDYTDNAVGRKKLEFYDNEGVCLFKFFVTADDPQRIYVWIALTVNMTLLGIVSACYVLISVYAKSSSRVLTKENTPTGEKIRRRNNKLQRKITLIIATDLICWLPITIVSCLHSANIFNATPYYPIISIVFLPINSVINPVLYSDILPKRPHKFLKKLANGFKDSVNFCQTQQDNSEESQVQSSNPPHRIPGHETLQGVELQDLQGVELQDLQGVELQDLQGVELQDFQGVELQDLQGVELQDLQGLESQDLQGVELQDLQGVELQDLQGVELQDLQGVELQDLQGVELQDLQGLELRDLQGVELQDLQGVELQDLQGVELQDLQGVELQDLQGVELQDLQGVELQDLQGVELQDLYHLKDTTAQEDSRTKQ
ncbi:hypothetical protein ACHWQZ_G005027 [Mnemiopsis leidyi]